MPTIVKAADAAQLLSLVPSLLGYVPLRSVVVIPMAHGRSLGALRLDLPSPDAAESVASSIVGMVCRIPDADAMIAVIYTDAGISAALADRTLAWALGRSADACGIVATDVLVVAADGWGSHLEANPPSGGRPLSDLRGSPLGPMVRGDQASGAHLPRADAAARRAVADALQSLRTSLEVICGIPSTIERTDRVDPAALQAACELDDLPSLFEGALGWDPAALAPMRAAVIAWCLARPALRDVAIVQWASDLGGGDTALEAQRRWEDGEEYPADLAAVMWGEGERPDPERLERALELARQVAAVTPKPQRAGVLAVCAWLSWALGRSTHADRYAARAQRIEPDHGLSDIVRSFVQAGYLPDWAFRRHA